MHLEGGCQVTDVVSGCLKLVIRSTHLWMCAGSATRTWSNVSAERVVGAAVFVIDNHGSSAAVAKQRPGSTARAASGKRDPHPRHFPSQAPRQCSRPRQLHQACGNPPLPNVRQVPPGLPPAVFASSTSLFALHYLNSWRILDCAQEVVTRRF
jgi:hypothetical protein